MRRYYQSPPGNLLAANPFALNAPSPVAADRMETVSGPLDHPTWGARLRLVQSGVNTSSLIIMTARLLSRFHPRFRDFDLEWPYLRLGEAGQEGVHQLAVALDMGRVDQLDPVFNAMLISRLELLCRTPLYNLCGLCMPVERDRDAPASG